MDRGEKNSLSMKATRWTQILAAISTTIGSFALGCGLAWTSPVVPNLVDCEDNPDKPDGCTFDHEFTLDQEGWIGSSYNLGAMVSGLVTGVMLAVLGRRTTMLTMAVPFIGGWILLTLTAPLDLSEPAWFYAGRVLTGFAAGSFALAAPIYNMEIAEDSIRGSFGILHQLMVTSGNVFVNGVGSVLAWPILTGIIIFFPALMAIMVFFMPESPYFLITRNKEKTSRKNLHWLRGNHFDIEPEISQMKITSQNQKEIGQISLIELFTVPTYLKPFLLMLTIHGIQQFCGINAIVFYMADIFLKAGLNIDNSLAASAVVSLTQVIGTFSSIFLVERVGRKVLLECSSGIMSVSILSLGLFFYLDTHTSCPDLTPTNSTTILTTVASEICVTENGFDPEVMDKIGWLPLVSLIVYKFGFSIGYGPLPWAMNGEFFPLEAKAISSAIVTSFNWFCAFVVSNFEDDLEEAIGTYGAYFLFSVVCFVATFFVIFFVPETKGKTADDMKQYFMSGKKASEGTINAVTILNINHLDT